MIRSPARVCATAVLALLTLPRGAIEAQEREDPPRSDSGAVYFLDGLNVTATRTPRSVFSTPAPVAVLDRSWLRRAGAANVADLFRTVPGLDAEGVGPAQRRL